MIVFTKINKLENQQENHQQNSIKQSLIHSKNNNKTAKRVQTESDFDRRSIWRFEHLK